MTKVQILEREVQKLNRSGLTAFRNWFRRYDAEIWDRQIERDIKTEKLDKFSAQALSSHRAGKTREL